MSSEPIIFGGKTAIGSLAKYISDKNIEKFQPMNVNFGLFDPLETRTKKKEKKEALSQRALSIIRDIAEKRENNEKF